MTEIKHIEKPRELQQAYDGSWYTIAGAGGDLQEWVDGYTRAMAEAKIGPPTRWYSTLGGTVNAFAQRTIDRELKDGDRFKDDLTILMFAYDGIDHIGRLAVFKLAMQDRWFDDVVQNMRAHAEGRIAWIGGEGL